MSKIIKLRKGLDINLQGKAAESLVEAPLAKEYAVSPLDFENVTPKLLVKVGDKVITSKYSGTEVKCDGTTYNIVRQSDILAIVE